jgi:hypothetical protein
VSPLCLGDFEEILQGGEPGSRRSACGHGPRIAPIASAPKSTTSRRRPLPGPRWHARCRRPGASLAPLVDHAPGLRLALHRKGRPPA